MYIDIYVCIVFITEKNKEHISVSLDGSMKDHIAMRTCHHQPSVTHAVGESMLPVGSFNMKILKQLAHDNQLKQSFYLHEI
jgi:hypothetical protein